MITAHFVTKKTAHPEFQDGPSSYLLISSTV